MKKFSEFLENYGISPYSKGFGDEFVDESQIDSVYDKAKIAVNIVRMYDQQFPKNMKLLNNVSTIANLASGAYGMYTSGENKKLIPVDLREKIRLKFGDSFIQKHGIENTPKFILKKYFPDLKDEEIKSGDVIHVNVSRIVRELGDTLRAVLEIASTIVHECVHELERETQGWTSEAGPYAAEKKFLNWAIKNIEILKKSFPQLAAMDGKLNKTPILKNH